MNQNYGIVIKEVNPQASLNVSQGFDFIMTISLFLHTIPSLIFLYIGTTSNIRWLNIFFILVSIVILFFLLRELYGSLRVPYSLKYVITDKGVLFKWQDFGHKEFFVPYILVGDLKLIEYDDSDRSVVFFQGSVHISHYRSSFLTDNSNGLLCFNNLKQELSLIHI